MIRLLEGDSLDILRATPEGTYTFVVTDPPYGLSAPPDPLEVMRQWLADGDYHKKTRGKGKGFMGAEWDHFVPGPVLWREVFRTCKPGAIVLCFAATRTMDWMSLSLRCAGFEILDTIAWLQAQGMAKAGTIDKKIDAHNGDVREVVGTRPRFPDGGRGAKPGVMRRNIYGGGLSVEPGAEVPVTAPASAESAEWAGWSTQLAPGYEPIIVARRPCEGTATANILRHGCGAMNIDACRIGTSKDVPASASTNRAGKTFEGSDLQPGDVTGSGFDPNVGRWPKNVLLDPSAAAVLDLQVGERKSGSRKAGVREGMGYQGADGDGGPAIEASTGGASRFFWVGPLATADDLAFPGRYVPKVRTSERHAGLPEGMKSTHPTVKPQALMRYLCRLAGTPGGRGLDPFAGSGSTLRAAAAEGLSMDGNEREVEFAELSRLSNGLPATEASGWIRLRNRLERVIVPRPRADKTGKIKRDNKGAPILFKPPGPTVAEIKAMEDGGRASVEAWLAVTGGDARILEVPFALTPWAAAFTPPEGHAGPSVHLEVGPIAEPEVFEWDSALEREPYFV